MKQDAQLTAVEWFNQQLVDRQNGNGDSRSRDEIFEQAKEMEKMKIIEAKIQLIKSIGNQGKNASLYGILKTTLIELQQQHNEIIARCLN